MHSLKAIVLLVPLVMASAASAQTAPQSSGVVSVPGATVRQINESRNRDPGADPRGVYATPPSLTLIPHSAQAHPGRIWIRSTGEGLHLFGRVEADADGFRWPKQKSEMLSSDHVEVWLAASPEVSMPLIGWGNQFGTTELTSVKDCTPKAESQAAAMASSDSNCEGWYNEQVQYRQQLRRLFARQWLIAVDARAFKPRVIEDFASSAWRGLTESLFPDDLPTALQPKADDGVTAEVGAEYRQETGHDAAGNPSQQGHQTGYNFHIFIPYTAFPPAQQLKLADLYLMVDVFSAAPQGRKMGDFSSTSATRVWGKPASFNHLRLDAPRTFSITPCEEKPEQEDLYGEKHKAWFLPTEPGKDAGLSSTLASTFALINPASGYLYDPGGVSPEATAASYFSNQLANGAFVCGPDLIWRKDGSIQRTKFNIDKTSFKVTELPDGWSLLRSGPFTYPHSRFGSGQCGACQIMEFQILAASPQGEISSALSLNEDMSGEGESADATDLDIAPDWKRITLYRQFEDFSHPDPKPNWTSTTYCLDGHAYKQCGESKQAKPPDPPNFKELRGND